MSATGVALRPVRPDDGPFLRRVYASTRLEELAPLGWSAAQLELLATAGAVLSCEATFDRRTARGAMEET